MSGKMIQIGENMVNGDAIEYIEVGTSPAMFYPNADNFSVAQNHNMFYNVSRCYKVVTYSGKDFYVAEQNSGWYALEKWIHENRVNG